MATHGSGSTAWLVAGTASPPGPALVAALAAGGAEVRAVERLPRDAAGAAAAARPGTGLDGAIVIAGGGGGGGAEALRRDLHATLRLAHGLHAGLASRRGRLGLVAAGPPGGDGARLAGALDGLGRALAAEWRGAVTVRTLHVDPATPAAAILDALARGRGPRVLLRSPATPAPAVRGAPAAAVSPAGRALVTGAASGLGRALARALAARGTTVAALDRDAAGLAALPAGTMPVAADLGAVAGLDGLATRLRAAGPFDLVIHAAGISATGPFERLDPADLLAVVDVNLVAPVALDARLLAAGGLADGGALVHVASLAHHLGYPGAAAYAASKDGLVAHGAALRPALAARGIAVLTVLPGPLDTPHAARHAPPGAPARRRMAPERAARAILARLDRAGPARGGMLVPGAGAAAAALFGRLAPGAATALMRRALYAPLARDARP